MSAADDGRDNGVEDVEDVGNEEEGVENVVVANGVVDWSVTGELGVTV